MRNTWRLLEGPVKEIRIDGEDVTTVVFEPAAVYLEIEMLDGRVWVPGRALPTGIRSLRIARPKRREWLANQARAMLAHNDPYMIPSKRRDLEGIARGEPPVYSNTVRDLEEMQDASANTVSGLASLEAQMSAHTNRKVTDPMPHIDEIITRIQGGPDAPSHVNELRELALAVKKLTETVERLQAAGGGYVTPDDAITGHE